MDIRKIISPKYDYTRDFEINELRLKTYPFNYSIDGKWTIFNSKGTNRILTDDF